MRRLQEGIQWFTREKGILSCLTVTFGNKNTALWTGDGYADEENDVLLSDRSLFDLASLTKLFTGLTVMRLHEEGLIDLNKKVTDYAPQFKNLKDTTVDQILGFEVILKTDSRIDRQQSKAEAEECLFTAKAYPLDDGRYYSDIHSMVLAYVAEGATGTLFSEQIERCVLIPCAMEETFWHVPKDRIADCLNYNHEHRIENGQYITRNDVMKGRPHDPKAHILMNDEFTLCGHAGLFSTRADMQKLCQCVLQEKVISLESLKYMAKNRTGKKLSDNLYTQYLGCQCYVKHPQQYYSEIPLYMSDAAIGLSGFTGNHVSLDPEKGIFALFLGNRVYNRLTVLLPEKGKNFADYGLDPTGYGKIEWTDGTMIPSSVEYVHHKDRMLHTPIGEILSERFK